MANAMKKLIKNGEVVKATISYRDNTYVIERTVYVNEKGIQYVKINGGFVELSYYKINPNFKFHGYWELPLQVHA